MMLVYFVTFIISAILAFIAYKSKSKFSTIFFSLLAILIPSILAGLRAKGVGTDTLHYISGAFNFARMSTSFNQLLEISDIEILYNLVNYIVSRFTDNVNAVYFALQFIICGFAYLACYKNKKICKPWVSYLIFLLLFFNRSLNMCRQSIAIVITLYSFNFALEKKPIKFFLLAIMAVGFHRTAIIFIPTYFLINIIREKGKLIYKILIFMVFLILFISYKEIISYAISLGLISSRYLYYVVSEKNNLILMELIYKIVVLGLVLLLNRTLKDKCEYNHILIYFMILDLLLYCTGIYANYAQRLSYYFGYYTIFLLPQISYAFKNVNVQKVFAAFIIMFAFAYSYVYYGVAGYDQTVPYASVIDVGDL